MRFRDRREAGRKLTEALAGYKDADAVVYALPRGGVVLGVEISEELDLPLDLLISRKIGHPIHAEYAVCAVTDSGHVVCDDSETASLSKDWLSAEIKKQQAEAKRRHHKYLNSRRSVMVCDKTAIIVDDGVATGLTMLAAIQEVRERKPSKIVIATPVVPKYLAEQFGREADEVVALDMPELYLGSVGAYYDQFEQVTDEEVVNLMTSKVGAYD